MASHQTLVGRRLGRKRDVRAKCGNIGNTKLWELMRAGVLPKPVVYLNRPGIPGDSRL
jgi:hypothetical protein